MYVIMCTLLYIIEYMLCQNTGTPLVITPKHPQTQTYITFFEVKRFLLLSQAGQRPSTKLMEK